MYKIYLLMYNTLFCVVSIALVVKMENAKCHLKSVFSLCLSSNIKVAKITLVFKVLKINVLLLLNFPHTELCKAPEYGFNAWV